MDKKVLKELKKVREKDIFLRGLIPWFGFNSTYLEFQREKEIKEIAVGHLKND